MSSEDDRSALRVPCQQVHTARITANCQLDQGYPWWNSALPVVHDRRISTGSSVRMEIVPAYVVITWVVKIDVTKFMFCAHLNTGKI
jgi:hypothetical protein